MVFFCLFNPRAVRSLQLKNDPILTPTRPPLPFHNTTRVSFWNFFVDVAYLVSALTRELTYNVALKKVIVKQQKLHCPRGGIQKYRVFFIHHSHLVTFLDS